MKLFIWTSEVANMADLLVAETITEAAKEAIKRLTRGGSPDLPGSMTEEEAQRWFDEYDNIVEANADLLVVGDDGMLQIKPRV